MWVRKLAVAQTETREQLMSFSARFAQNAHLFSQPIKMCRKTIENVYRPIFVWKLFSSTFVESSSCNEIYPIRCNTINEFCCVNSLRDQSWERTSRTQIDFFHWIMWFACDWQLFSTEIDSTFEETHCGWNIATSCNRNESVSQHWHTHLEVLAIFLDGFLCSVYLWMWFILWLAWFWVITEWFGRTA